jgi:hypothetical protein
VVAACGGASTQAHDAGRGKVDAGTHAAAAADSGTDSGAHAAVTPLANGSLGSACAADGDCSLGRCMLSEPITKTVFTGGYCTGRCATNAECGAHGLCASGFRGTPGSCYLACDGDADCGRDGYRCRTSSAGTQACVPGPLPLPDHVVGELCASDADCGGAPGTCSTALTSPGDGYCSQKCAVDADCGEGGLCISGVNGITLSIGDCYRSCTPPGDCRTGFSCKSLSGSSTDTRGACGPDRNADAH